MAASVQVLCPNGRRQNVKITPNTKLLQILEEVCQRQGFIPPEDYKLVQGRKELDLSLSVRFSSLPNNAKLELTKASSARVEQDVTIALQLDSGQRLQDSFTPSASLWDILLHLESKNNEYEGVLTRVDTGQTPALHPVCIYMREEVIGRAALSAMTLKKLGLTSGKAIIRLLHRPVDEAAMGEINEKVEKEKQKQAKLEELAVKKSEMRQQDELERNRKTDNSALGDVEEELSHTSEAVQVSSVEAEPPSEISEPVPMDMATIEDSSAPQTSSESSVSKSRSSRTNSKKTPPPQQAQSNSQPQRSASEGNRDTQPSAISDLRNMNIPGVEIFTPDDFNDLTPQEQAVARRLAQRFLPALMAEASLDVGRNPSVVQPQPEPGSSNMPFSDFRFPEATRGMDLSSSHSQAVVEDVSPQCDRKVKVYDAQESISMTDSITEDPPDDFFEITQADVRTLHRGLQNAVHQLEEQPLMTKAMRQAQTEALFDQYEQVVIRVQFPDRLVLQGVFKPRETVAALFSFVKDHLSDPSEKFYLYTAPPKVLLKDRRSSLAANRLAPAALVYFGSESEKDHYLSEAVRNRLTRRFEAESIVTQVLKPPVETDSSQANDTSVGSEWGSASQASSSDAARRAAASRSSASFSASTSSRVASSGSQVPKWLKLGKK